MILLITALLFGAVASNMPEEAAQIQVVDAVEGPAEDIFIKVNGFHKDTKDSVYMQVNLAIGIDEGLVTVNNQILPVKELKTFQLEAEIIEIQEGVESSPFTDTVTVHMFLHEEAMVQGEGITNALRLECQIIETDKYDVHMINVTEVVLEVDSSSMELRRTVTMISESESKLHQARNCPMLKCRAVAGCVDWKKNEFGCQTCQCAAMEELPEEECLSSCEGVCPGDAQLDEAVQDRNGCWICPCLVTDDFAPRVVPCSFSYGTDLISKFNELPDSVRIMIIVMLCVLSVVLTITCCITVCCNPAKAKSQRTNNLKTFGFGKLQIYVPDNEKKVPLIDNLDVVSADIA